MATITSHTFNWRIRGSAHQTGGSNLNGGGFNAANSNALATTCAAINSSATSITVASTTGWPSSGNYYCCLNTGIREPSGGGSEIVQITGGQGTTNWTISRAQLGTTAHDFTSGGTYSGAVTINNDLSRCPTAAWSNSSGASAGGTTTFADSTADFLSNVPGNVIWIASAGSGTVTVGPYEIVSVTNSTTLVLSTQPSSGAISSITYKLGGAWLDPYTNVDSSANILPGHNIFLRASGSGSKASPDYTVAVSGAGIGPTAGDTTNGMVGIIGENGLAYVTNSANLRSFQLNPFTLIYGLYVFPSTSTDQGPGEGIVVAGQAGDVYAGCIIDQNGYNVPCIGGYGSGTALFCELFSSVANPGAAGGYAALPIGSTSGPGSGPLVLGCNIHDCWGAGMAMMSGKALLNIIAKNRGDGVQIAEYEAGNTYPSNVVLNTIDGNHGNGITLTGSDPVGDQLIIGNIISNSGGYGLATASGTTKAVNDALRGVSIQQNWWYNNASGDALNLTVGGLIPSTGLPTNDMTGTSPNGATWPPTGTENYAIGAAAENFIQWYLANNISGYASPTSYLAAGAVQPQTLPTPYIVAPTIIRHFTEEGLP